MDNKFFNLDNASTTAPYPEVVRAIDIALTDDYLNMGAKYKQARIIAQKTEAIKKGMLNLIGATTGDVIITPSATAANNLAFTAFNISTKKTALVGSGEHSSVHEVAKHLIDAGAKVEFIKLTPSGIIDLDDFKRKMTDGVSFVSVMLASNETGAINPVAQIAKIAKAVNPNCIVHTDAVQALGKIDVNVRALGVDMLTISAHKICGPKGIGALYTRDKNKLKPIIFGGGQENGLVSGTENFAYLSGFYTAMKIKIGRLNSDAQKALEYKLAFINALKNRQIDFKINGQIDGFSPYILNIEITGVRGEVLLHALAESNILIATGSACSSKKRGNRTLEAMGQTTAEIDSAIRISFSPDADYDFDYIADKFKEVITFVKAN